MQVTKFTFNPFQENTYIVSDEDKNCVIIDPGCYTSKERNDLKQFIDDNELKPLALLNTHCHIDHVLGNAFVMDLYGIDLSIHKEDEATLNAVPNYAHLYGFEGYVPSPAPKNYLEDNQIIEFGAIKFKVIYGPGHAPGHVAFYSEENKFVINGDILFDGSFGRVDLPGGSMEVLKETITKKMFALPEDTVVYCGHGPETTIKKEKATNMIHQF